MASRASVVLVALLALCPYFGKAAEIMMNREDCGERCGLLDANQYSQVAQGASSTPNKCSESEAGLLEGSPPEDDEDSENASKTNELEPAMLILAPTDNKQRREPERGTYGEGLKELGVQTGTEPRMLLVQRVKKDTNYQPEPTEKEPNMLLVQTVGKDTNQNSESTEERPRMFLLQKVEEAGSNSEAKSEPMLVVPATSGTNQHPEPPEERQRMFLLQKVEEGSNGETKTEPMLVVQDSSGGENEAKRQEPQPGCILMVPCGDQGNNCDTKNEETQRTTDDDEENEIPNENLEKEAKEEAPTDTCPARGNSHHIKKDLQCRNDSREEDIEIGVMSHGRSKEVEDVKTPQQKKQTWKRAIDSNLAMQYVALLDKTMQDLQTKGSSYGMADQYSPWRRYSLDSVASSLYPPYFR